MIVERGNELGETYFECDICGANSWDDEDIEHKKDCEDYKEDE